MERRGRVVTDDDVRAFEAKLGVSLPPDYRQFILDVNGGRTSDAFVQFAVPGGTDGLGSLHSLNDPDSKHDLETRARGARQGRGIPDDVLPIGSTDGGILCLAIRGPHAGEVWILDTHDGRPEGSNPRVEWFDRRDVEKVANTFRAFAASLSPLE